jgi:ribosomal protein S18 acetylase RimI-like enzyme
MTVRRATPEDARGIAAIHVQSWRSAYQSIVPDEYLRSLSIDHRERFWRHALEGSGPETWVVEQSGEVRGWMSVGTSRDSDAAKSTGELWAIYVHPTHWRRGVGQLLWDKAEEQLKQSGFTEVILWVFKDNAPALAFYRSNGFVAEHGTEKTIQLGGADLIEVRLRKRLGG